MRAARTTRFALVLGTSIAVAIAPAAVAPASSIVARFSTPVGTLPSAHWAAAQRRAVDAVARTRNDLATHSLAAAVLSASRLAGVRPEVITSSPVRGLSFPSAIAAPVADLAGAIRTASDVATRSVHGSPRVLRGIMAVSLRPLRLRPDMVHLASLRRAQRRSVALLRTVNRHIDLRALYGAALLVARAIDRDLPQLQADAALAPAGIGATECDRLDGSPAVCVGDTGPNTYTSDVALTIDLGGNDAYKNAAGGADPTVTHLPVSVVLDLSGDDTYATTLPTPSGGLAAQGGARLGGVGILVDAGGNDHYSVADPTHTPGLILSHGAGSEGVGILEDLGGADSYSDVQTAPNVLPVAGNIANDGAVDSFGFASAGEGIFMDSGNSNDTYDALATPPLAESDVEVRSPSPQANGFGMAALGGTGLWYDDGGDDAATLKAISPPIAADDQRGQVFVPIPGTQGFGSALVAGTGLALVGAGTSSFTTAATEHAHMSDIPRVFAFGEAALGALSAFSATGGDDTYRAETEAVGATTTTVDDSCGCEQADAEAHTWGAKTVAMGIGYGGLFTEGAVGLMLDRGGNDSYTAVTDAKAIALAHSDLTAPDQLGATASAGAEPTYLEGQGFGAAGAGGFLLDGSGNDTYTMAATNTATARATTTLAGAPTDASASPGSTTLFGQGTGSIGFGELLDGGGDDHYATTSSAHATADPPTTVGEGAAANNSQGAAVAGTALFVDRSDGDKDTFSQVPAVPACQGTRGQDMWVDCGTAANPGVAVGINS